jgi:hypothetical protein
VVRLLVEEVQVDSMNDKLMVKHVIPLDKSFPLRSGSNCAFIGSDCLAWDGEGDHPRVPESPRRDVC